MGRAAAICSGLVVAVAGLAGAASPPSGRVAASVGDRVMVVDPGGPGAWAIDSGPIGWLFPAPGGLLYAPDLVGGRTTVVDLHTGTVVERLDGISMPRFGAFDHRYFVAAPGELLVASYPDRVPISTIEVEVRSPWQLQLAPDDSVALILDRGPEPGEAFLVAVDLVTRRTAYRRPLAGDVRRIALAPKLGLVALADRAGGGLRLLDPTSLGQVLLLAGGERVTDVAIWGEAGVAATVDRGEAGGAILTWQLKRTSSGLVVRKARALELATAGVGLAVSPDGSFLAVASADGALKVVTAGKLELVVEHRLDGEPRHLVWCDLGPAAPLMPEWSDERPAQLSFGDGPL